MKQWNNETTRWTDIWNHFKPRLIMHLDSNTSLITSTFCTSKHQAQAQQHTTLTHGLAPIPQHNPPGKQPQETQPPLPCALENKKENNNNNNNNNNSNNNHLPTGVPTYLTTTTAPTPPSQRPSPSLPQLSSSAS